MPGKETLNCKKVLEFYLKNLLASNSAITKELNIVGSTVGYIIRCFKQSKTTERKSGSGKKKRFQ